MTAITVTYAPGYVATYVEPDADVTAFAASIHDEHPDAVIEAEPVEPWWVAR